MPIQSYWHISRCNTAKLAASRRHNCIQSPDESLALGFIQPRNWVFKQVHSEHDVDRYPSNAAPLGTGEEDAWRLGSNISTAIAVHGLII